MSSAALDRRVAGVATAVMGAGAVLALAGVGGGSLVVALTGGAGVLGGAFVLLAGAWVSGLAVLVLSLSLPAFPIGPEEGLPIAAMLSAMVLAAWVIRRLPDGEPLELGAVPIHAAAVFLTGIIVSAAFAADRGTALREIVNMVAILGVLLVATTELAKSPGLWRWLPALIALVAGLTGVAGILQAFGVLPSRFPLGLFNRGTAGFGWPNELGLFLAVALPFCVFVWRSQRRWWGGLAVAAVLGGMASSFSRGSWLAAAIAPISLVIVDRSTKSFLRVWIVGVVAVVVLEVLSGGAVVARALNLTEDPLVGQRAALMLAGVRMFLDHPFVGVGPGGFGTALESSYGPQITELFDYVGSAHNGYIHVAAETGIIGLAGLLWLFGSVWIRMVRRTRRDQVGEAAELQRTVVWAFTTVCLCSMTEWPFGHGIGQLIMLVIALGLADLPVAEPTVVVVSTRPARFVAAPAA